MHDGLERSITTREQGELIARLACEAVELEVPMRADIKYGRSWAMPNISGRISPRPHLHRLSLSLSPSPSLSQSPRLGPSPNENPEPERGSEPKPKPQLSELATVAPQTPATPAGRSPC